MPKKTFKKAFEEYLKMVGVISAYANYSSKLEKIFGLINKSPWTTLSFSDYFELREQLEKVPNYKNIAAESNNVGKNALVKYEDFIKHIAGVQIIYFGAPGSGKSHKVKTEYDDIFPSEQIIRTTLHPDTDYAGFVGGYKPVVDKTGNITYSFVPQCFTNTYVKAWNDLENPYFLIIEEINRGNCAQIFGDIFQLLDRNDHGFSEYPINADEDLKDYLGGNLTNDDGIKDGKLKLPPNLSIIATMNTSDQSLFPMDSAFKRRWDWEYVPIEYKEPTSSKFIIKLDDGTTYKWVEFLEKVNAKIRELTDSEDKQMGNFFIKHDIDQKEFINKVMFYLWSEVGKENYGTSQRLFVYNNTEQEFSFNDLFGDVQSSSDILKGFMGGLGVAPISSSKP